MTLKKILKRIKRMEIAANNKIDSLFAGNYRSAFLGRGMEFADLRPYEFGDDIRDIDWKTTAKQGRMFVKKYEESRDNTLFFILDVSKAMNFASSEEKKFENLLETFAILAFAAVKNGDRVGVILSGRDEPVLFPPKKGRQNILEILSTVIKLYENKDFEAEKFDLVRDLNLVQKILKRSAVVFWLSGYLQDFQKNQEVAKKIRSLSLKHDFIPIVFSDKEERGMNIRSFLTLEDSLTNDFGEIMVTESLAQEYQKIYQTKRKNFLNFFRKYRMESIFIDSSSEIYLKLLLFFKKRQEHLI